MEQERVVPMVDDREEEGAMERNSTIGSLEVDSGTADEARCGGRFRTLLVHLDAYALWNTWETVSDAPFGDAGGPGR